MQIFSLSTTFNGNRLVSTFALILAMILWASSFAAMKYTFGLLDPYLVIWGRLVLASLCFLPFIQSFRRLPIKRQHLLPILFLGLCEPCFYFLFEMAALQRTTSSQASMIAALLPLLVAVGAAFFLNERLSRRTMIGFLLAACGAVWLSYGSEISSQAPAPLLGNFLELIAMVCATGYILLMKRLTEDLSPFFLTAVQAFIGALFFMPVVLFMQVEIPTAPPLEGLLVVAYLGIFVTIGAYGLYNFGVSRVPASQATAFINLIPAFALLFGYVILGERLTLWQMVACAVLLAGVIVSQDFHADHIEQSHEDTEEKIHQPLPVHAEVSVKGIQ